MKLLKKVILPALAGLALSTAVMAADVVYPGASGAGLVPPAGMTASKKFAGFEDAATGSSILFVDMPAEAWAQLKTGMTAEALKRQGVELSGPPREVKLPGGEPALLLAGKQAIPAGVFRKWILVAQGKDATVLITAQSPEAAASKLSDADVEKALLGLKTRAKPSAEQQMDALPFAVKDKAGFRLVNTLAGSALLLTDGPENVVKGAAQPLVIVAGSMAGAPPEAQRQPFARAAFKSVAGVTDITVKEEKSEADGRVLVSGTGKDVASGQAVAIVQVASFSKDGFIRSILVTREADLAKYRERFLKLAASATPR
ncbi:hypothetical protein ACERNI_09180 [Camelimonas sp. ID_303_24]